MESFGLTTFPLSNIFKAYKFAKRMKIIFTQLSIYQEIHIVSLNLKYSESKMLQLELHKMMKNHFLLKTITSTQTLELQFGSHLHVMAS
jgi:hypothetical protein